MVAPPIVSIHEQCRTCSDAATSTATITVSMGLYSSDGLNNRTLLKEFFCCIEPLERSYVDSCSTQCHINTALQTITMHARNNISHFLWQELEAET